MESVTELRLSRPAHRALANAGIKVLKQFGHYTEKEIAALHGIGPNAMKTIREAMKEAGISFIKLS